MNAEVPFHFLDISTPMYTIKPAMAKSTSTPADSKIFTNVPVLEDTAFLTASEEPSVTIDFDGTTELGSWWDVHLEDFHHGVFSVSFNAKFLLRELLGNISGVVAGDINPLFGDLDRDVHEKADVENGMDWISDNIP